ncbi:MAG TPA: ribulose-phosphate 3-epimerase [Acidobacteriota bacterium]|nr:ribulose-phosphate 3-epimerase [Acidobacteriota bacterium]HMZ79234.1 ribulose-phosphate 3-epimerase [Acidobacteriota bacterium]HNB71392.1 ribulose-phosphate 3-epimerase [Acidobacteriota bacterium]HND18319.1 ribulose-phosphate 3-epimerase [Acidobacteriota bacterium]HNG91673.1 ribulose-phosphate 3-epimerase [Acidobacteriota bacterium]
MIPEIKIAPSILSADFARLGEQVQLVEAAGAQLLHVDVMDGHYVPNITIGPLVVEALRRVTDMPLDTHLMISDADRYIDAFARAGSTSISVHVEAVTHLHRTLEAIRKLGAQPGIAINPGTSLALLDEVLPYADFILIMTVNPGFGGQKFIPTSLQKIARLRQMITERNLNVRIEVDGGIGPNNVRSLVEHGAEWIVAGSAIFGAPDIGAAVQAMQAAAEGLATANIS